MKETDKFDLDRVFKRIWEGYWLLIPIRIITISWLYLLALFGEIIFKSWKFIER